MSDEQLDLPPEEILRKVLGQHADKPHVRRWVSEFRAFLRDRETWYPGKDATFWERLGVHGDMPAHMPIAVNHRGQGPAEGDDIHHYQCWCGDLDCPLTVALQHAWLRGRAVKGVTYWLPGEQG